MRDPQRARRATGGRARAGRGVGRAVVELEARRSSSGHSLMQRRRAGPRPSRSSRSIRRSRTRAAEAQIESGTRARGRQMSRAVTAAAPWRGGGATKMRASQPSTAQQVIYSSRPRFFACQFRPPSCSLRVRFRRRGMGRGGRRPSVRQMRAISMTARPFLSSRRGK